MLVALGSVNRKTPDNGSGRRKIMAAIMNMVQSVTRCWSTKTLNMAMLDHKTQFERHTFASHIIVRPTELCTF